MIVFAGNILLATMGRRLSVRKASWEDVSELIHVRILASEMRRVCRWI